MIHRYEKQIHDVCMALFCVGMFGTIWHVGLEHDVLSLSILLDQCSPICCVLL